jgi:predicted AAA+ superfamily ATPase
VTFITEKNWGNLFENMVYLELRRQGYNVFYYLTEERFEIDFVVQNKQGQSCLLQVCWNGDDPETAAREMRALEQAKAELKLEGKILTLDAFLREGVDINKLFK